MAVDLNDGGIHHGVFHVWLVRDGIEQPVLSAFAPKVTA